MDSMSYYGNRSEFTTFGTRAVDPRMDFDMDEDRRQLLLEFQAKLNEAIDRYYDNMRAGIDRIFETMKEGFNRDVNHKSEGFGDDQVAAQVETTMAEDVIKIIEQDVFDEMPKATRDNKLELVQQKKEDDKAAANDHSEIDGFLSLSAAKAKKKMNDVLLLRKFRFYAGSICVEQPWRQDGFKKEVNYAYEWFRADEIRVIRMFDPGIKDDDLVVYEDVGGAWFTTMGIVKYMDVKNGIILVQSPHQFAKTRQKETLKECKIFEGEDEDSPFPSVTFDRYISSEGIEHCPDPQMGIKEVFMVLQLIVNSSNWKSLQISNSSNMSDIVWDLGLKFWDKNFSYDYILHGLKVVKLRVASGVLLKMLFVMFLLKHSSAHEEMNITTSLCIKEGNMQMLICLVMPLLARINHNPKLSVLRNATWTLPLLCCAKPSTPFDQVKPTLIVLRHLIYLDGEEVLTDVSYLFDVTNDKTQVVIEAGVCQWLAELLIPLSTSVLVPALQTVGNIVTVDKQMRRFEVNRVAFINKFLIDLIKIEAICFHGSSGVSLLYATFTISSNAGKDATLVIGKLLEHNDQNLGYDAAKVRLIREVKGLFSSMFNSKMYLDFYMINKVFWMHVKCGMMIDSDLDVVRKEDDKGDYLQGFRVCHSFDGGTYSGRETQLLTKIREEYHDRMMLAFSDFPSPKISNIVVELYNAPLSMHKLMGDADEFIVLEYCNSTTKIPSFLSLFAPIQPNISPEFVMASRGNKNMDSTFGAAFFSQTVVVNDAAIKFEIWDTIGEEKYYSLAPMYCRGAAAVINIIAHYMTNYASFDQTKKWVQELLARGSPNMVMVLAGNYLVLKIATMILGDKDRFNAGQLLWTRSCRAGW